ncbi:MAG: Ig-like domain-containing protein [Phycisphaerales bacterium]|jgi:hypothetical protein
MKKTRKRFLISWFSKQTAKTLAKTEEKLKAESVARAKAEEKLKAELKSRDKIIQEIRDEADKMLFNQYRRYGVWEERFMAQTRKKLAVNKVQTEEKIRSYTEALARAEEKVNSYAQSLAQAEEELAAAQEQVKNEASARAAAEEKVRFYVESLAQAEEKLAGLQGQAKTEDTTQTDEELTKAQEQVTIEAKARAQAEEKVLSYTTALAQAEENLAKAQEQVKTEAMARAAAEEKVRSYATALARAEKKLAKVQKRTKTEVTAEIAAEDYLEEKSKRLNRITSHITEIIKTLKQIIIGGYLVGVRKRKYALLSLLAISVIITAFTFAVKSTKVRPVADPGSVTTQEDRTIAVSLTGSDTEQRPLTYTVVTKPSHGSLSGTAPNLIYTPNNDFNGQDSFAFKVNNGQRDSHEATISITVLPVNDAPKAIAQSKTTKANKTIGFTLTGSDADDDSLNFIICAKPKHGELTFDANFKTNGRLSYTPEPYFAGSDVFTFKLNDGTVDSISKMVSIKIAANKPPVAISDSITTTEDKSVEINLTGTDPDKDQLTYNVAEGPLHGRLDGTAPDMTYTPESNYYGPDSFTFYASDNQANSKKATISIKVLPANDAPKASPLSETAKADNPTSITLTGSDTDGDPLRFTIGTVPKYGKLTLDKNFSTNGKLIYQSKSGFEGTDTFTFTLNDGKMNSAPAKVSINVNQNRPPVAKPSSVTTEEDAPVAINLTGTDPDMDPLTYSIIMAPFNGKLSGTEPNLTYTPKKDFSGLDNFTFKVNDGISDSAYATVLIKISPSNDPPIALGKSVTTQEDTPLPISLAASDLENDRLTYNVLTKPSHGRLMAGPAPTLTYIPEPNYYGPDSFDFKVSDENADSEKATISIKVLPADDPPKATPLLESTKIQKPLSTTLKGIDVDGDPLRFIICTEPEYGELTLDPEFSTNGKYTYQPQPAFEGSDAFTFKVNDGTFESAPATVSIDVTQNRPPEANPYSVTIDEDESVAINLTGTDPDKDRLTYHTIMPPFNGRLTGTEPNLIYTPNRNFNGLDNFTFKVNDGTSDSPYASVLITVSSVNDPPTAVEDSVITNEDTPIKNIDVLANDSDVDNIRRYTDLDTFSLTDVNQSANSTVTINPDGTLNYSPNTNFCGNDVFTYTVADDKGQSSTGTVNVTVNKINDAPSITSEPVITAEAGELYQYKVEAADPDKEDTLTYLLVTKPNDMTINSATGLIKWNPTEARIGTNEKVMVQVMDSNSVPVSDTQLFSIQVKAPPPKMATLTVTNGYNQRSRKTLSAEGKIGAIQNSDNMHGEISFGSYTSYDFSDLSIPADAQVQAVVIRVEHYEEERFTTGKLEWAVGTGWPNKPVKWASINASVHKGKSREAVDSWDVTGVTETLEKINSLQLQIRNNDHIARKRTFINHVNVIVKWK